MLWTLIGGSFLRDFISDLKTWMFLPFRLLRPMIRSTVRLRLQEMIRFEKHARLYGAIYSFRDIGHTQGTFDPLKEKVEENPRLNLDRLGFDSTDLEEVHFTGNYLGGVRMKIGEILSRLKKTYCGNIGVEYLHLQATEKRRWIQSKIEPNDNQPNFPHDEKISDSSKNHSG